MVKLHLVVNSLFSVFHVVVSNSARTLSQTKPCNPNCDTYKYKSDNMMIRITFLKNTTYFKKQNTFYPSQDKLKPLVFVVSCIV